MLFGFGAQDKALGAGIGAARGHLRRDLGRGGGGTVADSAVSGTSGGLVGCGGPSSVYLSTLSLGGATRIEYDRGRWNRCCSWSPAA